MCGGHFLGRYLTGMDSVMGQGIFFAVIIFNKKKFDNPCGHGLGIVLK